MFIPHIEIRRCNERMKQVFGLLLREKNILCFFLIDLILFACALFARSLFDTTYGTGFLILTILLCFLSFYFLIRSFMSLSERIQLLYDKVPYRARFCSDNYAAVLRLQNTQPKDRRIYTALTGILVVQQPVQLRKAGRERRGRRKLQATRGKHEQ